MRCTSTLIRADHGRVVTPSSLGSAPRLERGVLAALAVVAMLACAGCARCRCVAVAPAELAEAWTWGRFQRAEPNDSPHNGGRVALEGVIRELDGRIFVVKPPTEVRTWNEIRDAMLPDEYRRCLLLVRPVDPTVRSLIGLRVRVTGELRWTKSELFDWDDEPSLDDVRFERLR